MPLVIRPAVPADAALIASLVHALADYEQLAHEAAGTPEGFAAALFGPQPKVFCEIAELDGEPVGFALWYYSFSTFLAQHGLYLEDLFVKPEARGAGVGKALLAHLARRCLDEGLGRFEWEVLDWNEPAIGFYEAQKAQLMRGWIPVRLTGEALEALAAKAGETGR